MWMVMRHSHYNLYEEESIPLSYYQIFLDILSKNSCHQFRKFLYLKAFSCSNTQESLFCKIKKKLECFNVCWQTNNAGFAKRKIHKIIHMMTTFFVSWTPSFHWLWWLTKRFSKKSLCNFMWEGFGFFDYWVTKNFALYLWKGKCNDDWFQVPHEFRFEKLCPMYQH